MCLGYLYCITCNIADVRKKRWNRQTDTDGQTPDRLFTLSVTEAAGVKSVSLLYYCQPLCQLLIDFQNSFINILLCGRAIVKRLTSFEKNALLQFFW